jgi:hypothetical protein
MIKVELKNKSENPFYGMRYTLNLFQTLGKMVNTTLLDQAWEEVKDNKEKRQLFWSLLFSIGDITARQHNIFHKNKTDSGGTAARDQFLAIVMWMKNRHMKQFLKFMWHRLINEFISFDVLLATRIRTAKKTKNITATINMIGNDPAYISELSDFIVSIIKGNNEFDKWLVAKFLTRPRLSKRQKHKQMLPATKTNMLSRQLLLLAVSQKAGFDYTDNGKYLNFTGYYEWRKKINQNMESVMFSSGRVKELDQQQFIEWISSLPASARFRVRSRLLSKDNKPKGKWGDMHIWFLEWENYKKIKQTEQRILEEKVSEGTATMDDQIKLKEVKKEAKVNVGAVNFVNLFMEIIHGNVDKIKVQPFLDKINLPYNSLVFVDDSGSMNSNYGQGNFGFTAFELASFIATICLAKNPDPTGRSLIGLFSNRARLFGNITAMRKPSANMLLKQGAVEEVSLPLYEPSMHFLDNLHNIRAFLRAHQTSNGTNISSIPENLHAWAQGESAKIEQLQQFPVWTLISDGNFNNMYSPESSLNDFMKRCENYFGFRPFLVIIDVANHSSAVIDRFSGIDNVMFVPPNPAALEQFLVHFKDTEVLDIYTPLLSLFRSNRYALIRENTL